MSISFILVTFLSQLAVGMLATVAVLPSGIVDRRFFKSISFWSFLFTAIALVVRQKSTFSLPEIFGASSGGSDGVRLAAVILLALFGVLCLFLWGRIRFREVQVSQAELLLLSGIGIAGLIADSLLFRPGMGPAWAQNLLLPLNFLSASLMLGGFLSGMIFGHHYLVNTDMPRRLLVTMAWVLVGVLVLRIGAVGTTLLLYKEVIRPGTDFLNVLVSFQGHGIFFWERILVGLFIPAIVVAMIYGTAKIGSNQSATGIMYVAIAFVFIGELAARYLFLLSGIPL